MKSIQALKAALAVGCLLVMVGLLGVGPWWRSAAGHQEEGPSGAAYPPMEAAQPVKVGNYSVVSSIEMGVRGVSVDGNDDKYRSDVNYRAGFRLFESSFLVRADEGKGVLFDTLLVNSTGFGSDPYGYARINAEKGRWYRFDANFRRNAYDNRLRNIALGQHTARYKHNFGDFDLWLLPTNRRVRFNLGYSGDRERGPGTITTSLQGDQYQPNSTFRTRADEVRAGVEGRVGGVNLGFLQGFRWYQNDSTFTSDLNRGNNLTNSAVLNIFRREQPMRGRAAFTRLSATTTFARRVGLTARYTFTRVDNLDQVSFRARSRWTPRRGLSVNLNFTTRDNNNPGVGVVDRTIFGDLDTTPFSVDIKSRVFGGSVDYAPSARLGLSGGYTHMRLTTDAEILYFAGLPGNRFATGRSQYYLRDHFFYFNALAQLHRRVTAFASYRVNDDGGQGGRVSNDVGGLFIRSLPFTYQTPEARLSFRLGRRVDWNVGYQYYAYREKPPFNTGQDYRAHLPYTSLRVYFGGGDR